MEKRREVGMEGHGGAVRRRVKVRFFFFFLFFFFLFYYCLFFFAYLH